MAYYRSIKDSTVQVEAVKNDGSRSTLSNIRGLISVTGETNLAFIKKGEIFVKTRQGTFVVPRGYYVVLDSSEGVFVSSHTNFTNVYEKMSVSETEVSDDTIVNNEYIQVYNTAGSSNRRISPTENSIISRRSGGIEAVEISSNSIVGRREGSSTLSNISVSENTVIGRRGSNNIEAFEVTENAVIGRRGGSTLTNISVGENSVIGRTSGGNIDALTGTDIITAMGATTAGTALIELTNPSAITFLRINADNSVSALSAADFRTALSVPSISGTPADNRLAVWTSATTIEGIDGLVYDATGLGVGQASPSYKLDVTGTGRFTSHLYGQANVAHPSFSTGWAGNNWQIDSSGNAEFESMMIRGGLTVSEIILNRLHYQDGGLIIGAGGGIVSTIEDATVGAEVLTFEDPEGNINLPFTVGAIVMVQDFDLDRSTVVKRIVREVDSISTDEITFTTTAGGPADTGTIAVGDEMVAIGHTSDTGLDSHIYMSAVDSNSPFIRIADVVDSWEDFGATATTKVLMGNLESMASTGIVPASPGYGLYSDNVYLEGLIKATSGEIGGWTIDASSIYAGTEHATDDYADDGITLVNNGSLHSPNFYINESGEVGIRARYIIYGYTGVSSTVILNNTSTETSTAETLTKLKTVRLGSYVRDGLTVRIIYDFRINTVGVDKSVSAQVYRNGVAHGTIESSILSSWTSITEDLEVDALDDIELYASVNDSDGGTYQVEVRNLRICGELTSEVDEVTGSYSNP